MRAQLTTELLKIAQQKDFLFLTGDLGFSFFESLQEKARERFINVGIAEQSMVSMAAGFAKSGLKPWVYSIAPFLYARAFEQIRNDICFHQANVKLIGQGGGFFYGADGAEHHAVEDYGILQTLSPMQIYIPAFVSDVAEQMAKMQSLQGPSYLRLSRAKETQIPYGPWRNILTGNNGALVVVGPLAFDYLTYLSELSLKNRPSLWVVSELPLSPTTIPQEFFAQIKRTRKLFTVEEHVAHGSVGQSLAQHCVQQNLQLTHFESFCIKQFPIYPAGSEHYLRNICQLLPYQVLEKIGNHDHSRSTQTHL